MKLRIFSSGVFLTELKNFNRADLMIFPSKVSTFNYPKIFISCLVIFLYTWVFYSGGVDVPDRGNYLNFFQNPEVSRFEPLYILFGVFMKSLGFDAFFSVYITGLISILFLIKLSSFLYKSWILFFLVLIFLIFGIFTIFSFVQIRASLAIWLSVFLFFKAHDTRSRMKQFFYIILIFSTVFLHYLIIPFFIACFYNFYFRRISNFEILFLSIICLFFAFFWEAWINAVNLNDYYKTYFYSFRNDLTFSPFLWAYFLALLLVWVWKKLDRLSYFFLDVYIFTILGLPLVALGYFTGFDIFVKISIPFIALTYFLFFEGFYSFFRSKQSKYFLLSFSAFFPVVIAYAFFRY